MLADSVVGFHKCAAFLPCSLGCSTAKARRALPFVQEAEYLWESAEGQDWWDTGKRTFECTKRMLSTRLATAMFDGGMDEWGICGQAGLGGGFREVKSRPVLELAMTPQANIVKSDLQPPGDADRTAEGRDS